MKVNIPTLLYLIAGNVNPSVLFCSNNAFVFIKVMYSHNRPNITDDIGFPPEKPVRLVVTVRNPLLHKASIYFESVCRYGLHIKGETFHLVLPDFHHCRVLSDADYFGLLPPSIHLL